MGRRGRNAGLVLLDLDGTLLDSAPGIVEAVSAAYRAQGAPVPSPGCLRSFLGPPISEGLRAAGVPEDQVPAYVRAYREAFAEVLIPMSSVFDGIPEALSQLQELGFTLVVATSKPEAYARPQCQAFGLDGYLSGIFGAPPDGVTEPKSSIIARALATKRADLRAVMVGDRRHDVEGAAANGLECVGVGWGYAEPGELEIAGASQVAANPAELVAVLVANFGASSRPR